jgi:hypothetical protein
MVLAILIVGLAGTAVELLLLGHDESLTQLVPLILIGIGVVVIIWHLVADSSMSLRLMRITMTAFVGAGVLGIVLHYQGSVEFQKELDPSITGFELFKKAMQSKAPPALAPGTLVQLGLLGLVCTYAVKQGREDT